MKTTDCISPLRNLSVLVLSLWVIHPSAIAGISSSGELWVDPDGTWGDDETEWAVGISDGGYGEVIISGGSILQGDDATIGVNTGSEGMVIVSGGTLDLSDEFGGNDRNFYVGFDGEGGLGIQNAGTVTSYNTFVGYTASGAGNILVDGAGSRWTLQKGAQMGRSGSCDLVNTGSLGNYGTVELIAAPSLEADTYTPINASIYTAPTGSYVAHGGKWDPSAATFTVYDPALV